jgi:hypothetical protein
MHLNPEMVDEHSPTGVLSGRQEPPGVVVEVEPAVDVVALPAHLPDRQLCFCLFVPRTIVRVVPSYSQVAIAGKPLIVLLPFWQDTSQVNSPGAQQSLHILEPEGTVVEVKAVEVVVNAVVVVARTVVDVAATGGIQQPLPSHFQSTEGS